MEAFLSFSAPTGCVFVTRTLNDVDASAHLAYAVLGEPFSVTLPVCGVAAGSFMAQPRNV